MKLTTSICRANGNRYRKVFRIKVKCVGPIQVCERYNRGGIHFDGVSPRLTCAYIGSE